MQTIRDILNNIVGEKSYSRISSQRKHPRQHVCRWGRFVYVWMCNSCKHFTYSWFNGRHPRKKILRIMLPVRLPFKMIQILLIDYHIQCVHVIQCVHGYTRTQLVRFHCRAFSHVFMYKMTVTCIVWGRPRIWFCRLSSLGHMGVPRHVVVSYLLSTLHSEQQFLWRFTSAPKT